MTSFKPEVIADSTGKWYGNGLRFATRKEAEVYVADLASRWLAVRDTRVIMTTDPASHRLIGGKAVALEAEK